MTGMQAETAEKLANWASIGERDAPVAFVGRAREIDLAIRQLTTWRPGASAGRTIVAQGAPGAGKTALLREIGRRLPAALPGATSIYRPTPWNGRDVGNVLSALADRMMGVPADAFRTTTGSDKSVGAKAVATVRLGQSRSTAPPALSSWDDFETLFAPRAQDAKPTLLLVDEIQRMPDDEESSNLLYHLHDQSTFPVVLVCGGLSTSATRLGEVGLSRLAESHVLRIDALTSDEARQSLDAALRILADDVGVAGHPGQWARRLAPTTQGWPRHVTCHFLAAAEALRESGRPAFDDGNLSDALARAEADTRSYYDRRLEAGRTNPMIVFAVHEAINDHPVRRTEAMEVIDAVRPLLGHHEGKDHDGNFPNPDDCVNQMLYAGLVDYATTTTTSPLSIPIPSMATHIANRLAPAAREAVRRKLAPGR